MLPSLALAYDRLFGYVVAHMVRPPRGRVFPPVPVPATPDDLPKLGPIDLRFDAPGPPALCHYQSTAEVPSPWRYSRFLHGMSLGDPAAPRALVLLHGAYENEYTYVQWMARCFADQGYRVLIPAAPGHLDRAAPGALSGATMFWSANLLAAGLAQWLTEVRAQVEWLRGQGCADVGLLGFSLGSLVAGLAATLWSDLAFVALLAPVGSHLQSVQHSYVAGAIWRWLQRLPPGDVELLRRWSAVERRPVVKNLLFLITLYDALQPTALQWEWWRAWGEPPHRTYPNGHLSVLFSKQLYRDLKEFAAVAAGQPAAVPVA